MHAYSANLASSQSVACAGWDKRASQPELLQPLLEQIGANCQTCRSWPALLVFAPVQSNFTFINYILGVFNSVSQAPNDAKHMLKFADLAELPER